MFKEKKFVFAHENYPPRFVPLDSPSPISKTPDISVEDQISNELQSLKSKEIEVRNELISLKVLRNLDEQRLSKEPDWATKRFYQKIDELIGDKDKGALNILSEIRSLDNLNPEDLSQYLEKLNGLFESTNEYLHSMTGRLKENLDKYFKDNKVLFKKLEEENNIIINRDGLYITLVDNNNNKPSPILISTIIEIKENESGPTIKYLDHNGKEKEWSRGQQAIDKVEDNALSVEAPAVEASPSPEAPAVEANAEEAPSPEAPAVEAPVVEANAEEASAVEAPSPEAPAVEANAEEAPSPEASAVEAPSPEAPVVEAPAVEANDVSKQSPTETTGQLPEALQSSFKLFKTPTQEQYNTMKEDCERAGLGEQVPTFDQVMRTIIDKNGNIIYMEFPGENPVFEEQKHPNFVYSYRGKYFTINERLIIKYSDKTEGFAFSQVNEDGSYLEIRFENNEIVHRKIHYEAPREITGQLPEALQSNFKLFNRPTEDQYNTMKKAYEQVDQGDQVPPFEQALRTIIDKNGKIIYMEFPGEKPVFIVQKHPKFTVKFRGENYKITESLIIKYSDNTEGFAFSQVNKDGKYIAIRFNKNGEIVNTELLKS